MKFSDNFVEIDPVRQTIAEQHAATIIHNLLVGRPVDALAAIERCRSDLEEAGMPLTRSTCLQDLFADRSVCPKSLNAFEEHLGAWNLGNLLELSPHTLASVPNIGVIQLIELLQAVIQRLPVVEKYGDD